MYERDYSWHRLDFLNAFVDHRLQVLRAKKLISLIHTTYVAPSKDGGEYSSPRGSKAGGKCSSPEGPKGASRGTNPCKNFSCPLCSCTHKHRHLSSRPYLSVCAKFQDMSIQDRNGTCNRLNYCKLCTRDVAKFHKGPFRSYFEILKRKHGSEQK